MCSANIPVTGPCVMDFSVLFPLKAFFYYFPRQPLQVVTYFYNVVKNVNLYVYAVDFLLLFNKDEQDLSLSGTRFCSVG